MIEILDNHCSIKENTPRTGLLLFPPPTGSGKTYNVLRWIYSNYKDYCKDGRKIFFITNLKKNLPYEELRDDCFGRNNDLASFDKDVLYLDANYEFLIKNFKNIESKVQKDFQNEFYWKIKRKVSLIEKHENKSAYKELVEDAKESLRMELEPEFRKKITKYLKDSYPTKEARLNAIKRDSNGLGWIGELYPSVFTSNKKIVFLSIDKFLAQNSTLIESSYYFSNNTITENALVFIDEFDATKDNILKNIIEVGKKQNVDFIHLFNEIHWALSQNEFPNELTTNSSARERKISDGLTVLPLDQIHSTLLDKANAIVNEYKLQYSFKTNNSEDKSQHRNLLFHDFKYHSIYRNDNDFIKLEQSIEKKQNLIHFTKIRPSQEEKNIVALLNQIKGFVHFFQSVVKSLANNYVEIKQEQKSVTQSEVEFSFEFALSSVLEEFRLEKKHKNFIIETILSAREPKNKKNKQGVEILNYDLSIYENGFRYYDFVDNEQHETITKVLVYNFQNTPEKFILKLAERAKVVGISATALIETVTGNYDLEYLKQQLGSNFLTLTADEKQKLKNIFEEQNRYYDKVAIHTEAINFKGVESECFGLFEDEELSKNFWNRLSNKDGFTISRYFRILYVFKYFLIKKDMQTMLCLLNKEPKKTDSELNLIFLTEMFDVLIKDVTKRSSLFINDFNEEYKVENAFEIINSTDFENKKQNFKERLERGDKLFLISMYQTLGAGQNLQYKSPNIDDLINVRSKALESYNTTETDINGIYLDKPTHLIQLVNKDLNEEGFIKYLFQMEFMLERGRISSTELNSRVKNAFENLLSTTLDKKDHKLKSSIDIYKDNHVKQHYAKFIIQALGRICRTNMKAKNIYILADNNLGEMISDCNVDDDLVLNEFKALVKLFQNNKQKIDLTDNHYAYKIRASNTNRKTETLIKRFVNSTWHWKENDLKEWEQLRQLCLFYPTIKETNVKLNRILPLYIELPDYSNKYSYNQENDYEMVEVDFGDKFQYYVSEESARLPELMSFPFIKEYFEQKKYATTFVSGKFMMSPILFNNIYKGALGEEVGKLVFENKLGFKLESLPLEVYELFDYRVAGTDVYVDFKHWKESTALSAEDQYEKINKKLDKLNAKTVLIVNILSEGYSIVRSKDKRIIEIPSLLDFSTKEINIDAFKEIHEVCQN